MVFTPQKATDCCQNWNECNFNTIKPNHLKFDKYTCFVIAYCREETGTSMNIVRLIFKNCVKNILVLSLFS